VEALFTSALGLQPPWVVDSVKLNTSSRRIDFTIDCHTRSLACPACGVHSQPVHDRLHRSWDLDAKRLLFATEGRDHQTVVEFAADLKVGALPPVKGHRAAQPFITVRGCLAVK